MFGKKKVPKDPYPKQQYYSAPSQPVSYPQQTVPVDSKYQQPPGVAYPLPLSSAPHTVASAPPIYGEPPPPYSKYPEHQPPYHQPPGHGQYSGQTPYPHVPAHPQPQQPQYNSYQSSPYPTNYFYPAQPTPYPTQPAPHTVVMPGGFDACARFNAGAAPVIPPAPPGVVPNAAQMAASQGHNVIATQRGTNWFTGGTGGGPIF